MTVALPKTMRALEAAAAGPINTMEVVANRPVPTLPEGTTSEPAVLVKVHSAALNPVDWKMVELDVLVQQWPHAFGCDMSGTVVAAPEGSSFKEGDKVWAFTLIGPPHAGSLAEYVRVPEMMVGHVPEGISMESAATVGLGYLTAAFGLYKEMELPTTAPSKDFSVLVYGASSATGVCVLSMLKAAGYRAVAVASAQHHEWLKDTLGAAQCVDYHDEGWMDAVAAVPENKGMQFAFDAIGGSCLELCDEVLEKCGAAGERKIATVDPWTQSDVGPKSKLFKIMTPAVQTGELLEEAAKYMKLTDELLAQGKLVTMPTKVLGGLDTAVEGLEMLKGGKVRGQKLVVNI